MQEAYASLEQRMIDTYRETFPPFIPAKEPRVSEDAQKEFYLFIQNIYNRLFDEPELLFPKLNKDDFFRLKFNKAVDKKPELNLRMKSDVKKIENFFGKLFEFGVSGSVEGARLTLDGSLKISKKLIDILKEFGLSYYKDNEKKLHIFSLDKDNGLFDVWKWMATRENATLLGFSRCHFDLAHSYAKDVYANLLNDKKAFFKLIEFLEDNGYRRVENRKDAVALDYIKNYEKKENPLKDAWGDRSYGGISLEYFNHVQKPAYLALRIPKFKEILDHFDSMDDTLKAFVVNRTHKCNACGYCGSFSKEKPPKLVCKTVNFDKKYVLCPLFQAFYTFWVEINEESLQEIIRYLNFIDKTLNRCAP